MNSLTCQAGRMSLHNGDKLRNPGEFAQQVHNHVYVEQVVCSAGCNPVAVIGIVGSIPIIHTTT